MESEKTITLKSSDNQSFQIGTKAASRSKLINDILKDYQDESDFPLPEVDGKTLKKIIEYLEHYKDSEPKEIPKPLKDSKLENVIEKWDADYILPIPKEECVSIINAANYMDIPSLLQLAYAKIAALMMDLPVEEIQKEFGIENDMTEEEAAEYDKYPIV